MYTYEIWDRKSPVNDCSAGETGFLEYQDVYFIKSDNCIVMVQYRDGDKKYYPYEADTLDEMARLHCEALNAESEVLNIQNQESEETA